MGGASRFITLLASPFSPVVQRPTSIIFRRLLIRRISTAPTNSHLLHPLLLANTTSFHAQAFSSDYGSTSPRPVTHPWPEWSHLLDTLLSSQWAQSICSASPEDAFVVYEEKQLSDEFIRHASVCLAFSRSRPELLSFLSRKDIEVIATNGTPFLFKSALDIARRLRAYLGLESGKVPGLGQCDATLVDVMKYILSYARNPSASSERNGLYSREIVESSVRNLLRQMTEASFGDPVQKLPTPQHHQFNFKYEQKSWPLRQNVEMRRGDWICTKCSFMNFARNFECLECEEPRPKNHLTGREWHCPQCSFYNYGGNLVCLRCDCKRPGAALANNVHSISEWRSIDTDLSKEVVNEDIREITSLTARNTPLKRGQVGHQNQNSMAEYGVSGGDISESFGPTKADDSSIKRNLDTFHGHFSPILHTSGPTSQVDEQTDTSTFFPRSSPSQNPLPQDTSSTQDGSSKINVGKNVESDKYDMASRSPPQNASKSDSHKDNNQAEKSERWFQRVAELHNVKDLPSAISDEEFPEIMPMRQGENKFVVSKKKDRSLTSRASNRHAATGQAMNSNFVPYVPFPPGYFAREGNPSVSLDKTSPSSRATENFPKKIDDGRPRIIESSTIKQTETTQIRELSSKSSANKGADLGRNASQSHSASDATGSELGDSREVSMTQSMNSPGVKRLEGSAEKEVEKLDMSEEAKAVRWFRRVAQIKDISELSEIPDEDFPTIMPMRKGVNRFVVSKRKTPSERRLTSQYRRNLPL